ncbi:MAG: glycosyltransferase family 39 protein [Thiobacillaceae bacterium]
MTASRSTDYWIAFSSVLLAALALRWLFFTGYFGSDEVTYTWNALKISQGIWTPSHYIGSVRLGVNLPVGFLFWLFGHSEFVANLWSLLCSLGEIALVFLIANRFWGLKAAVASALLLAFTPLHAHYAGRLMADAPLGFFITLSFYALFRGDQDSSWRWHLVAGLAAGFVWWIKSAVALAYVPVFALFLLRERKVATKWLIMAAGFGGMVAINSLIFWIAEGDFWKILRMTTSGVPEFVLQEGLRTEPQYYLRYLLLDVKHTWLLGPLALIGLFYWARQRFTDGNLTNVAIWGIGLLGSFSLFVVSISPLGLITKQVNYMLIFLAPLALLGGYALSKLPAAASNLVIGLVVVTGVFGTALEQLAISSFVANSKSTLAFASAVHNTPVYGMTNAVRYSGYTEIYANDPDYIPGIRDIKNIDGDLTALSHKPADRNGFVAYAIIDLETSNWGHNGVYTSLKSIPTCWQRFSTLTPTNHGAGAKLVASSMRMVAGLPYDQMLADKLDSMLNPKPAYVFGISPSCLADKASWRS